MSEEKNAAIEKDEDIIRIEHLVFEYPGNEDDDDPPERVIKDVSLEIKRGSFVAVIGRNGSGKSTLARNLNGLLIPTEGVIYVNGWDTNDPDHIWDVRQTAGMVFQDPDNQIVSSIVEDDVAFGPENLGIDPKEISRRVDLALEAVRMGDYKRKAPHKLSGGQKQRIAIAGVIAMNPECIIFDEPTAMLDPRGRKEIMEIIGTLHERGITVILITHFMEEAVQADRIIIMNDGQVFLDGTPEEVFSHGDEMRSISLDVPMAFEIADYLRANGVDVPMDVINDERLAEFVCQYR